MKTYAYFPPPPFILQLDYCLILLQQMNKAILEFSTLPMQNFLLQKEACSVWWPVQNVAVDRLSGWACESFQLLHYFLLHTNSLHDILEILFMTTQYTQLQSFSISAVKWCRICVQRAVSLQCCILQVLKQRPHIQEASQMKHMSISHSLVCSTFMKVMWA